MSKRPRTHRRGGSRLIVTGVVGAAIMAAIWGWPPPDRTVEAAGWGIRRIGEADRYATAARLSATTFSAPSAVVYVASGQGFADALPAGAVAGRDEAPLLLTRRDVLPEPTAAELKRLRPARVVLLGGERTISRAVEAAIEREVGASVQRVAGADRYATAVALSQTAFPAGAGVAFLASGQGFPDGLAGGAWAAVEGGPLLLVARTSVPEVVADEIRRLGATSVQVLGGPSVISDQVLNDLGRLVPSSNVRRSAGEDRHATAVAIASRSHASARTAVVVTGADFPDALAAAPVAASLGGPLFLTRSDCMPPSVIGDLRRLGVSEILVVGGTRAVSEASARGTRCPDRRGPGGAPIWEQSISPSSINECRIPDQRVTPQQPNNVGFPHGGDVTVPSQGVANIIFIAAQFLDAPGEPNPMGEFGPQLRKMTEWSEFFSQGTFRYEFQTVANWISVPTRLADYRVDQADPNGPDVQREIQNRFAEDVLAAAGPVFDYAAADGVIFHLPASVRSIETDLGGRGVMLNTPAGALQYFFWAGGKYHHTTTTDRSWGVGGWPADGVMSAARKRSLFWAFWIHELLHSQGMALHAPGNGFSVGLGQDQYGFSQAIMGWEQFLLGWLTDSQVFCAHRDVILEEQVMLSPLEVRGGARRLAVVPLNASEALVVESRRPVGYSSEWDPNARGIFVYNVDTRRDNDRGAERFGDTGNDPTHSKWGYFIGPDGSGNLRLSQDYRDFLLRPGQSVTSGGVRITLVHSGDVDYVRITRVS